MSTYVIPSVARDLPLRNSHRNSRRSLDTLGMTVAIQATLKLICIFILTLTPAFALSSADQQRLTNFTKEIRCVVCQNQSIADSRAPLANDLREKIALMVTQHESDDSIKNYLVKRYGEFILLKPRLSKTTFVLWIFPFIGLGVIAWLLYSKNMIR
ncbi:MAG: cytochrome c-type biogenesis protein [Gammaproteobacteria bacterium]